MKLLPSCLFVSVCLLQAACSSSQKLPAKNETLKTITLANQYFMNKWPDAGKTIITENKRTDSGKTMVTKTERPSSIWTRGVYYEGLMALYAIDRQKAYYDYAVQWGEKHRWTPRKGTAGRNADDQCAGQTWIDLYLMDKKPERIDSIKACMDNMLKTDKKDDWSWIDALQMAMPVFVRLGNVYNDTSYYRKMWDEYSYTKYKHGDKGLYNPADHLWWRDKDFDPPYKEPNGQDCYWSRGNGWVVAALARTLEKLPKSDPHYGEYLTDFKDLLQALLPLQRADGYWNVSLKDSTHFGGKELTGTALFVYGMAWGINHKFIDKKMYLPVLLKAWNAMSKECVHPDGMLGYVQGTGKEPKDGQPVTYDHLPDFEDYGLGCFLLAGTEVYRLK